MTTPSVRAAAGVIAAAITNGHGTPAGIADAEHCAGLLFDPETAEAIASAAREQERARICADLQAAIDRSQQIHDADPSLGMSARILGLRSALRVARWGLTIALDTAPLDCGHEPADLCEDCHACPCATCDTCKVCACLCECSTAELKRLTQEREAEIRAGRTEYRSTAELDREIADLLAELDRVRAERDELIRQRDRIADDTVKALAAEPRATEAAEGSRG